MHIFPITFSLSVLVSLSLLGCVARPAADADDGTDTSVGTAGTVCTNACELDEDCQTDTDKSKCIDGGCFYFECDQDTDCEMGQVCVEQGDTRVCNNACMIDADCGNPQFACQGGGCVWLGCLDDADCELESGPGTAACEPQGDLNLCVTICSEPADCLPEDSPQYTPADFECVDARCVFLGCTPENCWPGWTCVPDPS